MKGWMLIGCCTAIVLHEIYEYILRDQNHQKNTKKSQGLSENGNKKSTERPDQSTPFLSQSSSVTYDKPRSSSAKSKHPATDPSPSPSPSPSSLQKPPSTKPTLSQLQSENGTSKSMEGTKQKPSLHKSKSVLSQSSSLTSDQPRSSPAKVKPPATESQSPLSFNNAPSSKPILSPLPSNSTNETTKVNCMRVVQKDTSPIYMIPKDIENLIKQDIVPDVLKKPLSPSTYKDYFATLLYAEDFYYEKWSGFQLLNVKLELHETTIYDKSLKTKSLKWSDQKEDKFFVAFQIDSVPERRPFLLSRDFVFARPSGSEARKFQGFLYRVVKSTTVLVEFEKDFYSQHRPNRIYDISFSFNRICLKRAHQAIAAASDSLFKNLLFPDCDSRKSIPSPAPSLYRNNKLDLDSNSAVHRILNFEGQPPYLVEGPLSKTVIIVLETVLKIYQSWPKNRILICASSNRICDRLIVSLKKDIPESDMFRANAAFRELEEVPDAILPLCLYEGECFSCPSLEGLRQYRVIFSTFVSSFRLHNEGVTAGHFSHIFLVDASSAIEPEAMIALNNFANGNTSVIVTGTSYNCPHRVRSDIARKNGLKTSYFERLRNTKTYRSSNPAFITELSNLREEPHETFSVLSFS